MHEKGIDDYSDESVSVFILWQGMFSADSEAEAAKAHEIMSMHRVFQFWDPEMLSAIAYAKETHPTYVRDLADALPEGHQSKELWMTRRDIAPERLPMWNYAAFYPPGIRWEESPPEPMGMIKMLVVSSGPFDPNDPHLYVVDKFNSAPVLSDWHELIEAQMERLMAAQDE